MKTTEKIMDLSRIWNQVGMVFPYFARVEQDWDETYREFLQRDLATETDQEHWLLLAEFLARLGDGHTDVQLPRRMLDEHGYLPFDLSYQGGAYYAEGRRVLGINGTPLEELLEWMYPYGYHVGNFIPAWRIRQLLPMKLKRSGNVLKTDSGAIPFDLLAQRPARPQRGSGMELREEKGMLYVRLDDFMRPGREAEIRPRLAGKTGVILDLRQNMGGMTHYGAQIAELFFDGTFHACQRWTRIMNGCELASASQMGGFQEQTIEFYVKGGLCTREDVERWRRLWNRQLVEEYVDEFGAPGQRAAYDGPVILLTGRDTVSAAEDFVAMFRSNHRALIVGEPTQGTSGTTLDIALTEGSARACTVGYRLLDGTEFIGRGIGPDVYLAPTPEEIQSGRDPVLEYALEYLKNG